MYLQGVWVVPQHPGDERVVRVCFHIQMHSEQNLQETFCYGGCVVRRICVVLLIQARDLVQLFGLHLLPFAVVAFLSGEKGVKITVECLLVEHWLQAFFGLIK